MVMEWNQYVFLQKQELNVHSVTIKEDKRGKGIGEEKKYFLEEKEPNAYIYPPGSKYREAEGHLKLI